MAYVVVLNQKSMVIRTAVTGFMSLIAAAYAEDRFHFGDWKWFAYSVAASAFLFFLALCSFYTIWRASSNE